ncbi:FUSC family protein [Kutzneria albida]|uniref:Integral membrane bound transporter domain-containing protein n=1 Tax=Kutzneria albida DSM 43870 TaxID=1449976 RepID=W5WFW3_9PSEU|nr:FUSC family protein [Kutzneria albida]AHI00094.1 hypothetical protein KALB_6735 [Kutzneria albida DSM 43870]
MRRVFDAVLDRFAAADPGAIRLRMALRTLVSVVLAIGVLALTGQAITAVMLGTIVAMMSAMSVNDASTGAKAVTFLLLPVAAGVSITVSALLEPLPTVADLVFLVIIFIAVYLRRYAPRGFAVGMVAFMTFFFSLFIHAVPSQLPQLLLAIGVALACSALGHFVLLPRRPRLVLRRVVAAFRARMGQLVEAVAHLVEAPDERRQEVLRLRVTRLHECALMIEAELASLVGEDQFEAWQTDVVDVELAGERLAVAARRAVCVQLPPQVRAALVAELYELRRLAGRDPRPAMAFEDELSMDRLTDYGRMLDALDGGPAVNGLRRAVRELAVSITSARRELETDLPPALEADKPEEAGRHRSVEEQDEPEEQAEGSTGLRLTTRQAIQATVGAGLAILGGELLSEQRWYWAVITAFLVFANTTSRGDILIRGFRRTVGTLLGILAGMVAATLVAGHAQLILVLIVGCVFLGVYVVQVSYGLMTFFMTMMLGLLYSLLGTFTPELLVLRLEETAIGAVAGGLAAVLVLPTRTRATIRSDVAEVLRGLREFVDHSVGLLREAEAVDLIDQTREIDKRFAELRKAAEPMVHVISPYRAQRSDLRRLLTLLASCTYYARSLAANAEPALLAGDERLPRTGQRIAGNLDRLIAALDPDTEQAPREVVAGDSLTSHVRPRHLAEDPAEPDEAAARLVTAAFDHLDELVLALGRPLGLEADAATEPSEDTDTTTARLLGQVRDDRGRPLAEAALTLVDQRGRQVGRSSPADDGRYRIEVPATGTYLLVASSPGRQPTADLVTLGAGPHTRDVVLIRDPEAWQGEAS